MLPLSPDHKSNQETDGTQKSYGKYFIRLSLLFFRQGFLIIIITQYFTRKITREDFF